MKNFLLKALAFFLLQDLLCGVCLYAGEGLAGEGLAGEGLAGEGLAGEGLAGEGLPQHAQRLKLSSGLALLGPDPLWYTLSFLAPESVLAFACTSKENQRIAAHQKLRVLSKFGLLLSDARYVFWQEALAQKQTANIVRCNDLAFLLDQIPSSQLKFLWQEDTRSSARSGTEPCYIPQIALLLEDKMTAFLTKKEAALENASKDDWVKHTLSVFLTMTAFHESLFETAQDITWYAGKDARWPGLVTQPFNWDYGRIGESSALGTAFFQTQLAVRHHTYLNAAVRSVLSDCAGHSDWAVFRRGVAQWLVDYAAYWPLFCVAYQAANVVNGQELLPLVLTGGLAEQLYEAVVPYSGSAVKFWVLYAFYADFYFGLPRASESPYLAAYEATLTELMAEQGLEDRVALELAYRTAEKVLALSLYKMADATESREGFLEKAYQAANTKISGREPSFFSTEQLWLQYKEENFGQANDSSQFYYLRPWLTQLDRLAAKLAAMPQEN